MMLTNYRQTIGNWRETLQQNERKTKFVILIFFLIYLSLGLLTDIVILTSNHPNVSLETVAYALITFKVIPYATLLMSGVACFSLFITFAFYDKIMLLGTTSYEVTSTTARNLLEKQLYNVVDEMKIAAGLKYMPKVYIIEADYMNAFASGYSEKSAMVAITRGLLEKLDREELKAVMSHELSHIRHHDIKLTLMAAVLSNILLVVIDVLFYQTLYGRERREDNRLLMVILGLRYILPLLTIVLTLFLSRTREYMADAGAVELMRDNEPMARALLKISNDYQTHASQYQAQYQQTAHEQLRQASYLFDPSTFAPFNSFSNLFSSHPSLEKRLQALGFYAKSDK